MSTRRCAHIDCDRPHKAHGLCAVHYLRAWRGEKRVTPPSTPWTEERIEDALWLLSWGTPVDEVMRRTGCSSVAALEGALRRAGHYVPAVMAEAKRRRRDIDEQEGAA